MFPIRDVNPTSVRPILTWLLIAVNAAVFFLLQPQEEPAISDFTYRHAAIACEITTGEPLTAQEIDRGVCRDDGSESAAYPDKIVLASVVTSMFLHGGIAHLVFNMWSLWIFGNNVEEAFGRFGYLILYALAGVTATFGFVLVNPDLTVPLVGASGAIAGVMGSYLVLFPRHQIMTLIFFTIVAVPAVLFLGFWFVSQFFIGPGAIAWEAHVAGFVVGALVTLPFRGRLLDNTLAGRRQAGMVY